MVVAAESVPRGKLGGLLGSTFSLLLLLSEFMTAKGTCVGFTWAEGADLVLYNSAGPAVCALVGRISLAQFRAYKGALTRFRAYRGVCHTKESP